ncbi:hypothetical protein ABZ930_08100 [Streptomyces sp. NPDC046716]|uniref:hypothetical protein n=1 Tax=Streptomyces sp. NPDC046716 TaxID=3157093 RepID=UPI003405C3A3
MNDLGDVQLRAWTLRWMALLAADIRDQLAWLGEQEVETKDVFEEVELLCRISEGLAERGVFESKDLGDLRAVSRRVGEIDAASRVGLWADSLATEPVWDELRTLIRHFLLSTLGDWHQPLPRTPRAPGHG